MNQMQPDETSYLSPKKVEIQNLQRMSFKYFPLCGEANSLRLLIVPINQPTRDLSPLIFDTDPPSNGFGARLTQGQKHQAYQLKSERSISHHSTHELTRVHSLNSQKSILKAKTPPKPSQYAQKPKSQKKVSFQESDQATPVRSKQQQNHMSQFFMHKQ